MTIRKFWVKLDIQNFILDLKITEKGFVKWVNLFSQNRTEIWPSTELKDNFVENSFCHRQF